MIRRSTYLLACLALTATTAAADDAAKKKPLKLDPKGVAFFEKHIRPVLITKCYSCHSSEAREVKGGLVVDTREGLHRGGDSGQVIVPGKPGDSMLIDALKHDGLKMPPKEVLPDSTVAKFVEWIRMGAPDPRAGKSTLKLIRVVTPEIIAKARTQWPYTPIAKPTIPRVKNSTWAKTNIDRFLLAKWEAKKLQPARAASLETLVRRLYFDLWGLPPTPAQVDAFKKAAGKNRDQAIEKLVDELLASKRFAERWGRHWMDVVRYAESTGMERNFTFPQAWRYRDYVINSVHADKPYDQFIKEQIAGDLLKVAGVGKKLEALTGTGMLALGPKSLNERNREQFAMDVVDDQIDVTTRAFLGLTASCARCHDHKFDPIPQTDYYALAGIFRSTNTYYGTGGGRGNRQAGALVAFANGKATPLRAQGNARGAAANQKQLQRRLVNLQRQLAQLQKQLKKNPRNQAAKQRVTRTQTQIKRLETQVAAAKRAKKKNKKNVPAPKSNDPKATLLMATLDGNGADTQLRIRGEVNRRGKTVPRGFLSVATDHKPKLTGSGRMELAKWIASGKNPLTARVAVNRAWQHLLGRGIVGTPNNFGVNGDDATHPELIDHLASQFISQGWSTKKLVKSIVLSRAYQMSSGGDMANAQIDPGNKYLWRANHKRLEAEAIRDAILTVSGKLDLEPEKGSVVSRVGNGYIGRGLNASQFRTATPKRSVYLPIIRSEVPEFLRLFDFPEPSNIAGQREVTTVPTQALYLMNSRFVMTHSGNFAARLLKEDLNDEGRVKLAYRLAFAREPSQSEVGTALSFIANACEDPKDKTTAFTAFCQALFASAEFRYVD